jgi:hypothetical protein
MTRAARNWELSYCGAVLLRKLVFDTSAINMLAADVDCDAIIKALGLLYRIGITETAISEIIATEDEIHRKALLDVVKRLLAHGNCIMPFNWIIEEQAKVYQRDSVRYDWKRLNVRVPAAEEEVARQEFMHSMSEQTRREMKEWGKQYLNIFRDAKPAFQSLFVSGQTRPSVREVTEKLMGKGGAHLEIGVGLFERAAGTRPTSTQMQEFIERCPPFRALLVALCFTQYDRCIREERQESLGKAGRNDMFSAVYLPYCKIFVTDDDGQCKAMKVVADLTGIDTAVLMYEEFKSGLVGLR